MVPTVPTGLAWPDEPLRRVLLLLGAALSLGSASQVPPYSRCKVTVHSSDDVAAWEYHSCQPQTTDLARYARIHVDPMDITCGKPPENICALENPYLCAECDVSMLGLSHPPHLMVDAEVPDTSTFWQSASWHRTHPEPLRANITFSWGREVELTHDVVITFQSRRPAALVLERSRDHGRSWRPLQFYADDCLEEFGMEQRRALDLLSEDVTKVICTEEYSGSFASKGIRTVRMEIQNRTALLAGPRLPPGRVSASPYGRMTANPALRDFLTLTDLRLSLLRPATGGTFIDKENLQKYHYAISDVQVPGRCQCNLHASECVFNAGRLACICQHRTAGPDCSKCQRGFRSRRWRQGSYLPYPMGSANVCLPNNAPAAFPNHERIWSSSSPLEGSQRRLGDAEVTHRQGLGHGGGAISHAALWPSVSSIENKEHSSDCYCNGHSDRCSKIEVLNLLTCVSCKHNTDGEHCHICRQGFYRNSSAPLHHPAVCIECNCNAFGATHDRCDSTGQCECKEGTRGLKCDSCLPGYHWHRGCQPNTCDRQFLRCHNGGICHNHKRCICPPGYSGARCEKTRCETLSGGCSGAAPAPSLAAGCWWYLVLETAAFLALTNVMAHQS